MTADDSVRVVLPVDPPELSSRAARILLEILLDAAEKPGGMSVSRTTITPESVREEAAEL